MALQLHKLGHLGVGGDEKADRSPGPKLQQLSSEELVKNISEMSPSWLRWLQDELLELCYIKLGTCGTGLLDSMRPEPGFIIKMSSYRHRKSHCRVKTIVRSSRRLSGKLWYLHHNCVGDTIVYN